MAKTGGSPRNRNADISPKTSLSPKAYAVSQVNGFKAVLQRRSEIRMEESIQRRRSPRTDPLDALMSSNGAADFNALLAVATQELQVEQEEAPSLKMQMAMASVVHDYDSIPPRPEPVVPPPTEEEEIDIDLEMLILSPHFDDFLSIL